MVQRLSLSVAVIFLQVTSMSSLVRAQTADADRSLALIENTANRICGIIKETGIGSTGRAKTILNVELRGLASQLGAGTQGTGEIASENYQNGLREQLGPVLSESAKCRERIFIALLDKLIPGYGPPPELDAPRPVPPPPTVRSLSCQSDLITKWLSEHGIYGDLPFDISIYADAVYWTVNGKLSTKKRSEIAKDEEVWRKLYPVQKYTPITSSADTRGGQCVLTQRVEGYKRSAAGKVELDNFNLGFTIRNDANGPRIVERQTEVLRR